MEIASAINLFLSNLTRQNFSPETVRTRRLGLKRFVAWCRNSGIFTLAEIGKEHLQHYTAAVFASKHPTTGEPLSTSRKRSYLISLKLFYRFLAAENLILHDPLAKLKVPNEKNKLPAAFLSERQVSAVLKSVELSSKTGVRNRAILEVLYSTGIRRKELVSLKLSDVDFAKGVLWVRGGKNARDRVVPIGNVALGWIRKYLNEGRPYSVTGKSGNTLFIGLRGKPLSKIMLGQIVHSYCHKAGIKVPGACHLFRHSMATHMLARGADVRYLKEILGHSGLSTTAIYTRVEINSLQTEYEKKHPGHA